jgi:DNA-binding GntR family transcriptional regulator
MSTVEAADPTLATTSRLASFAGRRKLGEEVTSALRESVLTGAFRRGEWLRVEDLAAALGVSPMPVREALIALASEGTVEAVPRRGFRVADLGRADFEDVFRVHAHVAGLLAGAAALGVTREQVATLRALQARIDAAATGPVDAAAARAVAALNHEFHRTINHVPDAGRLRWFLRAATRFIPRRFYEEIPAWAEASRTEHPALVDALERGDAEAAQTLMSAHVAHAGRLVIDHLAGIGYWDGEHPVTPSPTASGY